MEGERALAYNCRRLNGLSKDESATGTIGHRPKHRKCIGKPADGRPGPGRNSAALDSAGATICAKPAAKRSIAWFKSDGVLAHRIPVVASD